MRRVALIAGLALAGCAGSSSDDDVVIVSAASSLQTPFEALGGPRYSFAGSDQLAAQIRQGVRPDVFAAADTILPQELFAEGLVEEPVVFAGNRLVLAVPAEGSTIGSIEDLEQPGVTIAVGSADVPVGEYTREVLGRLGTERAERVLANVRSEEPDVKGVVGKLVQGVVDAGFVYATDVTATGGELRAIELPESIAPAVEYGVAVVVGARHREEAEAFVESLRSGDGRRELERAGFSVP